MSQFLQYLSASSFNDPLEAVVAPVAGVVATAGTVGTVGGAGDAACILMCLLRDTFLSALYEQCGHAYAFLTSNLFDFSSSSSFAVSSSSRGRCAQ